MKKFVLLLTCFSSVILFAQDLRYYLPDSVRYNPKIPVPKDIIHHEVGEWHVTHDRLVNYMQALAKAAPERIRLETMGYTYEMRPQVLLIITSQKKSPEPRSYQTATCTTYRSFRIPGPEYF